METCVTTQLQPTSKDYCGTGGNHLCSFNFPRMVCCGHSQNLLWIFSFSSLLCFYFSPATEIRLAHWNCVLADVVATYLELVFSGLSYISRASSGYYSASSTFTFESKVYYWKIDQLTSIQCIRIWGKHFYSKVIYSHCCFCAKNRITAVQLWLQLGVELLK